ncbi:restriction endonuclease subunit S [Pseudoxanthomonas gei]|uniref:Restriction endonuclease subunit S n=1 Tax=Pseudoxanthomonas gei TaxID=1383030 RepID=A0ABX0A748_9GAMM|nr:restriction endonuclease subunit S [Pseudoxanthomonas gei]NDK37326.1 restriction endonuclease subunit S [Pseudoxanthomonas gei]
MSNGWHRATLKDLCVVDWGNTDLTKAAYVAGGEFLAVSAAGCDGRIGHKEHSKHTPVLSAIGAQCGKMFFPDEDFTAIKNTITLTPRDGQCTGRFLYYLLTFVELPQRGAGQPFISKGDIQSFAITFPSLHEQQRIVRILDDALAGIATAKANAEKNLRNARAIFEAHIQSVFTQHADGRKSTTLGEVIDLIVGFAFKSAKYTDNDDGVRLLRGDNIVQGRLRWDDVKKWSANDVEDYKRYWLREDDVVLAMDRPWVKAGLKRATIASDDLPALLVQRTASLRSRANIDSRFLMHLIGSEGFVRHILGVQTGIGVPHISGQQIKDFKFSLPTLAEQRQISNILESLRVETQRLESLYRRKLAALDALKKSLLHQAFSGQL